MCDPVFGARAANRASKGGLGGADVVSRQAGGYSFYYHSEGEDLARFVPSVATSTNRDNSDYQVEAVVLRLLIIIVFPIYDCFNYLANILMFIHAIWPEFVRWMIRINIYSIGKAIITIFPHS